MAGRLTIETESGRIRGVADDRPGVRVYRGIPYAAPPVGPARFDQPWPPAAWSGVRDALAFGPSPMQPTGGPFGSVIPGNGEVGEVSEDCLTLNVWAPEDATGLPVMVWVYGGAYLGGGTAIPTYDGARLCAEQQVIVVSANYRVGVFGFLWPGEQAGAPANAGLLDQIAALKWVQRNISAFGGDPTRVTAFGESAGAGSLLHVLCSPRSGGVMRRLICQSPGVDHALDPDRAAVVRAAFLAELGLDDNPRAIDRLRDLPAASLLEAQARCLPALMSRISAMPFHPVADGEVVPEKPSMAVPAGAGSGIDLLLTWTSDEMRLFPNTRADTVGRDGLVRWADRYLASRLGRPAPDGRAADLVDFYLDAEAAAGRDRPAYAWAALQTDGIMRLPARRLAEARVGQPGATYCAQFGWPAPGGDWQRGAFHAIDLPFVFGTLDSCGWRDFLRAGGDADVLSGEMRAAWASFARTGVPSGPVTGSWPAYSEPDRDTVMLNSPVSVESDPLSRIEARWAGLWSPDGGPPPGLG